MIIRKIITREAWPDLDRTAWNNAIADGDVFDGRGPAAHWSSGTRRSTVMGYGRWLGWLLVAEHSVLSIQPQNRLTPGRLRRYIDALKEENGAAGIWNYVKKLYDAIRVMAPDTDWSWLKDVERRLGRDMAPAEKRNRIVFSDRLVELGLDLMDQADNTPALPAPGRAQRFRDGLLIALLAMVPLRRRNIAMIEVGKHLKKEGGSWQLAFETDETKSHHPLEFEVPAFLVSHLEHYLDDYRPMLPNAADHDFLWASMKGGGLTGGRIYDIVSERTARAFGNGLSIHLFRDCAATTIATKSPETVMAARDLLGHTSFNTTQKHYVRAQTMDTGCKYTEILERLRGGKDSRHYPKRKTSS